MTAIDRDEGLIAIDAAGVKLEGNLIVPDKAKGVVLFAHGSGSSRFSSRNRHVAAALRKRRLGTLLIDLLSHDEEHLRFDIELLAARLTSAAEWLGGEHPNLKIGLFGASTGGAAALVTAARIPKQICAVVSRGGRPDLADESLPHVKAPTLLIVGGDDVPVIGMNREAYDRMTCVRQMEIIPGASHLFEEEGALEEVARLAGDWFLECGGLPPL